MTKFKEWSTEKKALATTPLALLVIAIAVMVPSLGIALKLAVQVFAVCCVVWFMLWLLFEILGEFGIMKGDE